MVPSSSAGGSSGPAEEAGWFKPGPGRASRTRFGWLGGFGTAGGALGSMAGATVGLGWAGGVSTGGSEPFAVGSLMSSRLGVGVLPKDSCEPQAPNSKVSCLIIVSNEVVRGR